MTTTTGLSNLVQLCLTYCWVNLLRPIVKGFLRRTTGLCELQRICYATHGPGADRCCQVQSSILMSRSSVMHKIRDRMILNPGAKSAIISRNRTEQDDGDDAAQLIQYAVEAICQEKKIKTSIHQEFTSSLRMSLAQLYYYKMVADEAGSLAATAYEKGNPDHEYLLLQLWNRLKDDNETDVRKPDWTEIGFQGKDASTDFRGMGLLGLHQLLFLATEYNEMAKSILSSTSHPIRGYPFAITGINLTSLTVDLTTEGHLRTHMFNLSSSSSSFRKRQGDDERRDDHLAIPDLHHAYVRIFAAFHAFWIKEDPIDVMQFRFVREKFVHRITTHLSHMDASLNDWSCPLIQTV